MARQSRNPLLRWIRVAVLAAALFPSGAQAHSGPADPIASSYRATLASAPPGTITNVLGGDQRLWLQVVPAETLTIFDDRGTPYLRFSPSGVEVNHNSSLYFLNLRTPVTPATSLPAQPNWVRVTAAHVYSWHDGRLHALASVAAPPRSRYLGRWTIPALVGGRPSAFSGALLRADRPSIVWFWAIAVVLLCVLAAWRVRRPALDVWTTRVVGAAALVSVAVATLGRQLYGRPSVTVSQLIVLALVLALTTILAAVLALGRAGFLSLLVAGLAALGVGIEFLPTLVNGYVFTTLPSFIARAAATACLSAGPGLLLLCFRAG